MGCCGWVVSTCRGCVPICRLPDAGWRRNWRLCAYLIGVAGIARPSAGCCEDGETASRTCMPILRSLGTGWRGVVREPADACVSHPHCADTCSSAGSYGCARPASRVCASICELPFAVMVPLAREPTDVCASSRCCRKPVPICGFLLVRGSGLSDLHAHLVFAGHNPAQELPVACVSYRCSGG